MSVFCFGLTPEQITKIDQDLTIKAIQDKWTFEFDASQVGLYKTGLKDHGLTKGKKPKGISYDNMKSLKDVTLPLEFDWREKKLGAIRDQGNCGSCWAFSITSVVNDLYMLFDPANYKGQLSEQYLVSCARDMYGCDGGMPSAFKWMIQPQGAPLLADWPYTQSNGRCDVSNKKVAGSVLEWHYVGDPNRDPSVEEIKKAVFAYGPVSVTIAADNSLMSYKSGVFNACRSSNTNHMTNIVGWSDSKKAFIMRNSWGEKWGEAGYGYIAYTDSSGNLCNAIGEQTTYAKVTNQPPKPPAPVDFKMDFDTVTFEITVQPEAKYTVEELKKAITTRMRNTEESDEDEI